MSESNRIEYKRELTDSLEKEVVAFLNAGTDRAELIENRDYGHCSLVKAFKAVLDRVDVENTIFTKIGYPLREEQEIINSIAMREALVNAVVHNDYSYGAVPKVEFFSDRVEITSMGGLPYGVTQADFFGGCSVPRNKEIMRVFRDLEIVEHLGSGIPRILNAYGKEAFDVRDSYVRIVFYFKKEGGPIGGPMGEPIGGPMGGAISGAIPLTARQKEIVALIQDNPKMSLRDISKKLGLNRSAIDKHIVALKEKGVLKRVGGTRGYWKIINQEESP